MLASLEQPYQLPKRQRENMSLPPAGRQWIQRDKNPAERLQINGETLEVASSHHMLCKYHFFPAYNTSNTTSWTVLYVVLKKRIKLNSMERSTYVLHRQVSRSCFLVP